MSLISRCSSSSKGDGNTEMIKMVWCLGSPEHAMGTRGESPNTDWGRGWGRGMRGD